MKLLFAMKLPYLHARGGANRSNRVLAELLAAKGHHVTAVVSAMGFPSDISAGQFIEDLSAKQIKWERRGYCVRFRMNGVLVDAVLELRDFRDVFLDSVIEFDPDLVVISTEDPTHNLLEMSLRLFPNKIVYLVHTPIFLPFGPASLFPNRRCTQLLKRARSIIGVSRFVGEYVSRSADLECLFAYLPNFGRGGLPDLGGLNAEFVTMINACDFKGISIFLALARSLPGVKFAAVLGWGTASRHREALANLKNMSVFQTMDDINDILRKTRVLLAPSLIPEGFGSVIVEAMLRRIPVISSDCGGCREARCGEAGMIRIAEITAYSDSLDENLLPIPIVPEQPIDEWKQELQSLLANEGMYVERAIREQQAARQFVSALSIIDFERLLESAVQRTSLDWDQSRLRSGHSLNEMSAGSEIDLSYEDQSKLILEHRRKLFLH